MARKISKTKQKQKQKQSQKVIVNITPAREKRVYRKSKLTKDEPKSSTKPFIPLMPSFNINQPSPSPSTDLAKILGMLIPKLQTESTLGNAIPNKVIVEQKPKINIGGLINPTEVPSLKDAIDTTIISEKKGVFEKPRFENPYYETESEAIPLVEAEVKPKRKYIKSGKYSKKPKATDVEVEEE
jgi:hypothetical protein